jgi:hypothetical protein
MNSLVNSIAKEVAVTEERPTEPDKVERSQYFSGPMVELSLAPLMIEDVESEIKEAFESHGVPYVKDVSLIDDVGERAVQEIDLLIRLSNPETQYAPDWLLDSEEPTVMAKILGREDFVSTYREHLVETYEISDDVAGELLEVIIAIVDTYEEPIINHWADTGESPVA